MKQIHHQRKETFPKKNPSKVIALITDFGLHDQYVAVMKGVILSINQNARIVDISHEVLPLRIRQAGYLLWSAYKYFPKGTIFVGIVDPGVGGNRRIICLKTKQYFFLAPDNGLLDFIICNEEILEAFEISLESAKKYIGSKVSSTFHGRDIFAPIASNLSNGISIKKIGLPIELKTVPSPFVSLRTDSVHLCILHIDRFGNIITNLMVKDIDRISKELQAISVGRNLVSRWIKFYDEAPENTPCLIAGSSGLVEISVRNNNASNLLNANLDTRVKVYWR